MRQGSHSKRNRGRGGNRRSGTPGRNHTFDSNGPDIRIRGNAHQVHEKYMNLAREASTNGEAVLAESYFQHAEHYYRILSAFTDEANNEQNKNRATQPGSNENNNHDQQETPTTQSAAKNGKENFLTTMVQRSPKRLQQSWNLRKRNRTMIYYVSMTVNRRKN